MGGQEENGSIDWLERLSIVDAKELLENTREERVAKEKDMQVRVTERYHELIESSQNIQEMHQAVIRLQEFLIHLPDQWNQLQNCIPVAKVEEDEESKQNGEEVQNDLDGQINFILESSEKMYSFMDQGLPFDALKVYEQAKLLYKSDNLVNQIIHYPFLKEAQVSLEAFPLWIKNCARRCLEYRGQSMEFYGLACATLYSLEELDFKSMLVLFLQSRDEWIQEGLKNNLKAIKQLDDQSRIYQQVNRKLTILLRSVIDTLVHTYEIFHDKYETIIIKNQVKTNIGASKTDIIKILLTEWLQCSIQKILITTPNYIHLITVPNELSQLQICLVSYLDEIDEQKFKQISCSLIDRTKISSKYYHRKGFINLWKYMYEEMFVEQTSILLRQTYQVSLNEFLGSINESELDEEQQHIIPQDNNGIDTSLKKKYHDIVEKVSMNLERFIQRLTLLADSALVLKDQTSESSSQLALRNEGLLMIVCLLGSFRSQLSVKEEEEDTYTILSYAWIASGLANALPRLSCIFQVIEESNSSCDIIDKVTLKNAFDSLQSNYLLNKQEIPAFLQMLGMKENNNAMNLNDFNQIEDVNFNQMKILIQTLIRSNPSQVIEEALKESCHLFCTKWTHQVLERSIHEFRNCIDEWEYQLNDEEWRCCYGRWELYSMEEEDDDGIKIEEKIWLPYSETPHLGMFLFSCCHVLDSTFFLSHGLQKDLSLKYDSSSFISTTQSYLKKCFKNFIFTQIAQIYSNGFQKLKEIHKETPTHPFAVIGECCTLQMLFDLYYIRAAFGNTSFVRFGWDEEYEDEKQGHNNLLLQFINVLQEQIDPINWEIYGPPLVQRINEHYQRSCLLYSIFWSSQRSPQMEKNDRDSNLTNGESRNILQLMKSTSRFSLLPIPISQKISSVSTKESNINNNNNNNVVYEKKKRNLLNQQPSANENILNRAGKAGLSLMGQMGTNIFSNSGSNLLSVAASSSSTLLSASAAKSTKLFTSATSYLRDDKI